jgi:hypothetical protein
MSASFQPTADCDRYLLVDDTDEDVTQILTIACESFGSRTRDADRAENERGVQW